MNRVASILRILKTLDLTLFLSLVLTWSPRSILVRALIEVNVFSGRVDSVLKHLTETRDFDHRLRALENEVKPKLSVQEVSLMYMVLVVALTCFIHTVDPN